MCTISSITHALIDFHSHKFISIINLFISLLVAVCSHGATSRFAWFTWKFFILDWFHAFAVAIAKQNRFCSCTHASPHRALSRHSFVTLFYCGLALEFRCASRLYFRYWVYVIQMEMYFIKVRCFVLCQMVIFKTFLLSFSWVPRFYLINFTKCSVLAVHQFRVGRWRFGMINVQESATYVSELWPNFYIFGNRLMGISRAHRFQIRSKCWRMMKTSYDWFCIVRYGARTTVCPCCE